MVFLRVGRAVFRLGFFWVGGKREVFGPGLLSLFSPCIPGSFGVRYGDHRPTS